MTKGDVENEDDEEEIPSFPAELNPFWKNNAEKFVGESISAVMKGAEGYSVLIYLAPLVLWLLSLIFAVMVLFRKRYEININSTSNSKRVFEDMVKIKYRYIRISGFFLIFSFVALDAAFLHYLNMF